MSSPSNDWETTLFQSYLDYHTQQETLRAFHDTLRDDWQAFADALQANFPDLLSVSPHIHSHNPEIVWQGRWHPTGQTITLIYRNDSFDRVTLRFLADTVLWEHTWDSQDRSPLDCNAIATAWHLWVMASHATYPATSDDFAVSFRWPVVFAFLVFFLSALVCLGLFSLATLSAH